MTINITSAANAGSTGTLAAPGNVASSEAISKVHVGKVLEVHNGGGSPINVTFVDPGRTPAGNTGTQAAQAVAAGARRRWKLTSAFVNADGEIVVQFSGTTSVTGEVIS